MKIEGFEKFVALGKENVEAVVKSSSVALQGLEEISKHSQAYFTKSVEKADSAIKALLSVKSPTEFAEIQNKLARENIETAIADSRKFSELTQSVISASLEPINARIAAFQALAKSAA